MADGDRFDITCVAASGQSSPTCGEGFVVQLVPKSDHPEGFTMQHFEATGAGLVVALAAYCLGAALAPLLWIVTGRTANGL